METDPSQTVRGMAEELGASSHAVFVGLKRSGKVKNLEKWVPHDLNDRQKLSRFEICSSLLLSNRSWIGSSRAMKIGSYTTTADVEDSGKTPMNHSGTFQR